MYCGNNPVSFADPDGLKVLTLVRGAVDGYLGAIDLNYDLAVKGLARSKADTHGYEFREVDATGAADVATAILESDELWLYGHGSPGRFYPAPGAAPFTTQHLSRVFRLFRELGRTKMKLVMVLACATMVDDGWVNLWLRLSTTVFGYSNVTFSPLDGEWGEPEQQFHRYGSMHARFIPGERIFPH